MTTGHPVTGSGNPLVPSALMGCRDVHVHVDLGGNFAEVHALLHRIDAKLTRILERQGAQMADTTRLLQSEATLAAAVSAIGTDTSAALAAIRTSVDGLRAIVANDPAVQAAIDTVANSLDAGAVALGVTDAAIKAAGADPGSPVPPVEEPPVEPPVEPPAEPVPPVEPPMENM